VVRPGLGRVEFSGPVSFEIDRVEEEHNQIGIDAVDDPGDAAVGMAAGPVIDNGGRLGGVEIQGFDGRIVRQLVASDEIGVDLHALAVPDGIGNLEFDLGIELQQQAGESGQGGIQLVA